jgi:type IV secretion system protein VirD4
MLQDNGYKVKILNTIDFKKSMKYNPFAYLKTEKDILKLVTVLMENTEGESKGGDGFWKKAETLLYCALIGYIHFEAVPEQRNMNTMCFLIQNMETREEDEEFQNAVDLLFEELEKGNPEEGIEPQPDHFAVRQYKSYKLAAGKTAKSILISCAARLAPFDIAEVRNLMSADEMELDKLGGYKDYNPETRKYDLIVKQKTALFVIIPDTDTTFNFIVGMMYSQMFNILCDIADNEFDGRLPVHVRGLFDEFANIGAIPSFDKLIATIRSREISATIVLQSLTQLKTLYKDSWEVIVGNCDTNLFLGGKESSTLKEWAETLGKQTIDMDNDSESFGQSKSKSRSSQKLARDLMSVDEIAVMSGNKCLLHIRGARPFLSKKYDITTHKNYKYLMDAHPKNKFDVEKYMKGKSTKLNMKKDEKIVLVGPAV